jgi:hypothetical protein
MACAAGGRRASSTAVVARSQRVEHMAPEGCLGRRDARNCRELTCVSGIRVAAVIRPLLCVANAVILMRQLEVVGPDSPGEGRPVTPEIAV